MNHSRKHLAYTVAALFIATFASGQGLESKNLFGTHAITIELKPNVTLDQFKEFYVSAVIPEYEKAWPGLRGYLVKSFRDQNKLAIVWLFKNEAARNRYFTADDKPNDLEKAAYEKVKPVEEQLKARYGTYTVKYQKDDDWVVE